MGFGCKGCENWVVDGDRASNLERSGVMVLDVGPFCGFKAMFIGVTGVVGLGVDQANCAGGCDNVFAVWVCLAGPFPQPASIALTDEAPLLLLLPFTRRSKSSSLASPEPLFVAKPEAPSKDMKSSLPFGFEPLLDPMSSCNALVCSCSTRDDRVLINSMKD